MAKFCGGIKLGESLAVKQGVICVASEEPDFDNIVTPCGQSFDGVEMEVVKHGGIYVLTSVSIDEDMEMPEPLRTNCGFKVDPRYFSINENGELEFDPSYVAEILVEPHDATIAVTYGNAATLVDPIAGTTNMFKLTETDATYTVSVSKDGYTSQEQQITADQNHIVEFTLVAAGG